MAFQEEREMTPQEFADFKADYRHMAKSLDDSKALLEQILEGQRKLEQRLPVLERDVSQLEENNKELEEELKQAHRERQTITNQIKGHATIWKIVGGSLFIVVGLATYAWNQIESMKSQINNLQKTTNSELRSTESNLQTQLNSLERRLSLVEYQNGTRERSEENRP